MLLASHFSCMEFVNSGVKNAEEKKKSSSFTGYYIGLTYVATVVAYHAFCLFPTKS